MTTTVDRPRTAGSDFAVLNRRIAEAGLLERRPAYYAARMSVVAAMLVGGWAGFFLIGSLLTYAAVMTSPIHYRGVEIGVFAIDAASFVVSAYFVWRIKQPEPVPQRDHDEQDFWFEAKAGARIVARDGVLRALAVAEGLQAMARLSMFRASYHAVVRRMASRIAAASRLAPRPAPEAFVVDTFSETLHPPIVYPAALLPNASGDAAKLLEFLKSDAAHKEFLAQGFTPVARK